jgi:hypothetical protein
MTRRFELGPIIVAIAGLLLVVSLFLDWYGPGLTAWDAFELVDLLLAALALASVVLAVGTLTGGGEGRLDRRAIPWLVAAAAIIVAVSILNPPPAAAGRRIEIGAWIGFAAALAMLVGAVLSISRVSFSVALEGREPPQRVAAVDQRQQTTETAAVVSRSRGRAARQDGTDATQPTTPTAGTDEG